jgi:ribA/ribD-fused uncharacterized protein
MERLSANGYFEDILTPYLHTLEQHGFSVFVPPYDPDESEEWIQDFIETEMHDGSSIKLISGALTINQVVELQKHSDKKIGFAVIIPSVYSKEQEIVVEVYGPCVEQLSRTEIGRNLIISLMEGRMVDGLCKYYNISAAIAVHATFMIPYSNLHLSAPGLPSIQNHAHNDYFVYIIRRYMDEFSDEPIAFDVLHQLIRKIRRSYKSDSNYALPFISDQHLFFEDHEKPYGFLSNFSAHPIFMGGRIWKTVEHYYQASKFDESEIIDQVADAISPLRAKEVSRIHSGNVRKDWDTRKEMVMYRALNAKFSQHPDIQAKLIETHPLELIEYSEDDAYWGDPGDHTGANRLGHLLMDLRMELLNGDPP